MVKLAYNPVTGKFRGKSDTITALTKVEAGLASIQVRNLKDNIESQKNEIAYHERQKRQYETVIEEQTIKLKTFEGRDSEKIKKEFLKQIKKSDIFERGLIKNIQLARKNSYIVYVITEMLSFYPGTPLRGMDVKEKIDLGHYIIKLDLNYTDINMIQGICNLDYVCDYHTPTVKFNQICWGNSEYQIKDLIKKRNIIDILDFLVGYIMSPHDHAGFASWRTVFATRLPVKTEMTAGYPLARFQRGGYLPIIKPLTEKDYKKIVKTLTYQNFHSISCGSDFTRLREIDSNYPNIAVSRRSASEISSNCYDFGLSHGSDKIPLMKRGYAVATMMRIDKLEGNI